MTGTNDYYTVFGVALTAAALTVALGVQLATSLLPPVA